MFDEFTIPLNVTIRACQESDLQLLEWFGLFADYRTVIAQTFKRHQQGEVMMLVAEANYFPVGQLWIDLVKKYDESVAIFWALRVIPCLQNLGIGSRLLLAAEHFIQSKGFTAAEIGVEKDNLDAFRLYERLAYQIIAENLDEWDFTTPKQRKEHIATYIWCMQKKLNYPDSSSLVGKPTLSNQETNDTNLARNLPNQPSLLTSYS